MDILVYAFLWMILGLAALVWGGGKFVIGSSAFARNLGVPPLLVGLTIVAFGTSAPEIFVSVVAALKDTPELALGNAIGSNIANIGLVIGLTTLIVPLEIHSDTLKREYPLLLFIMLIVAILLWDNQLSRLDGLTLIASTFAVIGLMIYWGLRRPKHDPLGDEFAQEIPSTMPTPKAIFWIIVGLILLPLGSELTVHGAIGIAKYFHISDLVIGLTIVALGTSLPELTTSLVGALKGEHDIAIGNVLGSNMFNLLAVIGLPALINPFSVSHHVLTRDYGVMLVLTCILFGLSYFHRGRGHISRWGGGIMLLIYLSYMGYLAFLPTTL